MASAAVIGALRVVIGADSAALDRGLKDAGSKLSSFGANVAKVGAAVAAGMAVVGTGIAIAMKGAINEADKIGKSAQKIGIPVEELSKLKHAADLSGIGFEQLEKGIGKFSRSMMDASLNATGPAANAFRALGASVQNSDGTLRSSSAVMTDIAGRFEGMKDGAAKTALAMQLFGKSGADLIPLLNSGKGGLKAMMEEAEKLGLVISEKTAKAAEGFNDDLTRLARVKNGIFLQLTAQLAPALEYFTSKLVAAAKESNLVQRAAETLSTVFTGFARGVMFVYDNFGLLIRITAAWIAMNVVTAVASAALAFVRFAAAVNLATLAKTLFIGVSRLSVRGLMLLAIVLGATSANAERMSSVLNTFWEKIKSFLPEGSMEGIADKLKALGLNIDALTLNLLSLGNGTGGARKNLEDFGTAALTMGEEIKRIGERSRQAYMDILNGAKQMYAETRTPLESYRDELAKVDAAYAVGAINSETHSRALAKAAERAGLTWQQQASSIGGSIAEIGNAFASESKKMAMVAKIGGVIQATVAMWQAGAEALKLGWPWGIAAAATMIAKGASIVASIRSISVGGFATGGSFRVPGGAGGGDRVRAMVDLEPGEQVDVWRPGHGPDPRRGGTNGGVKEIVIRGLTGPKQLFTGNQVRELVEMINESIGDGTRLRFAS